MASEVKFIIDAVKSLNTVNKFVYGNPLIRAIRSISGEDSTDAAILALSTKTTNRKERINSAINHLESAHVAYSKLIYSIKDNHEYEAKWYDIITTMEKDLYVCALITLCHLALEDYPAAWDSTGWGTATANKVAELEEKRNSLNLLERIAHKFDPRSYLHLTDSLSSPFKLIRELISGESPGMRAIDYVDFHGLVYKLLKDRGYEVEITPYNKK